MNQFECKDALPLIGAYSDGELSEAQADPLRKHLMSCHACRNSAQANKASRRWFQRPPSAEAEDLIPAGFAARVARLAFAGETGEHAPDSVGHLEPTPALAAVAPGRAPLPAATRSAPLAASSRGHIGFLLEVTGIAAAVLVALTVAFRMREVPSGEPLRADQALTVQEIKDRLGELNEVAETTGAATSEAAAASGQDL